MTANLDQIEAQRQSLTGHCYCMLGSAVDADDAAQETVIRAWKTSTNSMGALLFALGCTA